MCRACEKPEMNKMTTREDRLAIQWEIRDGKGGVVQSGMTGGVVSWLLHKTYSEQNIIKRAKWSAGRKMNEATNPSEGDGDICRLMKDGNTLHIWKRPDIDAYALQDLHTLQTAIKEMNNTRIKTALRKLASECEASLSSSDDDFMK